MKCCHENIPLVMYNNSSYHNISAFWGGELGEGGGSNDPVSDKLYHVGICFVINYIMLESG